MLSILSIYEDGVSLFFQILAVLHRKAMSTNITSCIKAKKKPALNKVIKKLPKNIKASKTACPLNSY